MKEGTLILQPSSGRMDVRFGLNDLIHCGTQLEVFLDGRWIPTRIEIEGDWYLVGSDTDNIAGLKVRI